jgi:hypothetical protein
MIQDKRFFEKATRIIGFAEGVFFITLKSVRGALNGGVH